MKSPAFQFYPNDFLGSPAVSAMTAEEVGIYVLLLCLDWNGNGFALEIPELARSCRVTPEVFESAWRRVGRCFHEKRQRYFNPRLEAERRKQREWRRKSSIGGKLSAAKRAKGGSRVVEPTANTPSPTPSPTPVTTTPSQTATDAVFEEAWAVYPRRPGNSRQDTYRQWLARVKDGVDPLDMLAGARRYAQFVTVEGTEPRYVKQAQTFFGRGRHFEADWTPTRLADPLTARVEALMAEEDAALERTRLLLLKRSA